MTVEHPVIHELPNGLTIVEIIYDVRDTETAELVRRKEYSIQFAHSDGPPFLTLKEWIEAVKHLARIHSARPGLLDPVEKGVPDSAGGEGGEGGVAG